MKFSKSQIIKCFVIVFTSFEVCLLGLETVADAGVESTLDTLDEPKEEIPIQESLVSREDWISDFEARLTLAQALSYQKHKQLEAIEQYTLLLMQQPENLTLELEISRLYISLKRYEDALIYLNEAIEKHPQNKDVLLAAAQAEAGRGHAERSKKLFLQALSAQEGSTSNQQLLLSYADAMMSWGDFYKAEEIYRCILEQESPSFKLSLKLAGALAAEQRYAEAEAIYRSLLFQFPKKISVLKTLVGIKIQQKNFDEALELVGCLRDKKPEKIAYIELQGDILMLNGNYEDALQSYKLITKPKKNYIHALIESGKIYRKLCQPEIAAVLFQEALAADPANIEAQYYLYESNKDAHAFIEEAETPQELEQWAQIYLQNGISEISELLYRAALEKDAEYFPAQVGLAEMLSINYQYDEALSIYDSLLEDFPQNSKVMLARARVLSWAKRYQQSLNAFDEIIWLNPNDPVPRLEKARTAFWGKMFERSMKAYDQLLSPRVDVQLYQSLRDLSDCNQADEYVKALDALSQSIACGTVYQGYEVFSETFTCIQSHLSFSQIECIQTLLLGYYDQYLIQKAVFLEKKAKKMDWDKRYLHALCVYGQLIDFVPGNEEALYSYAQDWCTIGRCDYAREVYKSILDIDPNHNLVKMALGRNLVRSHPGLQFDFTYWRELGSGSFSQSQIARYRLDTILEEPISCRARLRFIERTWVENPFFNFKFYPAAGGTIEGDFVVNDYIKFATGVTYKNYFNAFKNRISSNNNVNFNICDYVQLTIGLDKENEIYNYFSLKQGTQSYISTIKAISNLTHHWNIEASFQRFDYNDNNTQLYGYLKTEYAFTENPNVLKAILYGCYRNTKHNSISIIVDGELVDVIHPYWTPQHYFAGSLTLQFRKDFRPFEYCEAPERYFDLKITGEQDNVNNPSIQCVMEWRHECDRHWGFALKGMIHRSPLWNAEGAWATISYRF